MTCKEFLEFVCDTIEYYIDIVMDKMADVPYIGETIMLYERKGSEMDHNKSAIIYVTGFYFTFRRLSELTEEDVCDILRLNRYANQLSKLLYKTNGKYLSRLKHKNNDLMPFNDWAISIINNAHFDIDKFTQENPLIHKMINISTINKAIYKKELVKCIQQSRMEVIYETLFYKHDYDQYLCLVADSEIDEFVLLLKSTLY